MWAMPSRWAVPLTGDAQAMQRHEARHAVISRWLDHTREDHDRQYKDWSLGSMRATPAGAAMEIATLTPTAAIRLHAHASPGQTLRLDGATHHVTAAPVLLETTSWEELAAACRDRVWTLRFHTPATFRQKQRTSPLPKPESLLQGLADQWTHWTGRPVDVGSFREVWVSDLDLSSQVLRLRGQTYSGATGTVTFRANSAQAQTQVGPLFRLAPFTGVGSKTTWGLGHTSLEKSTTARSPRSVGADPSSS